MGYFTTQTLLLTVVAVVIPFADAPQMAGAGAVGAGGFGLQKTLPKQQFSGLSTGLKYILDEEEAGYSTAKSEVMINEEIVLNSSLFPFFLPPMEC